MSENWQAGDLALCIKVGPWMFNTSTGEQGIAGDGSGPQPGRVYTVRKVCVNWKNQIDLRFEDYPDRDILGWTGYAAERFRKVTPPAPDAFDRETIELMRGKPVEVA